MVGWLAHSRLLDKRKKHALIETNSILRHTPSKLIRYGPPSNFIRYLKNRLIQRVLTSRIVVSVDFAFSMELNKNGGGKDENIQQIQGNIGLGYHLVPGACFFNRLYGTKGRRAQR
jgi:hypothetical protein